MSAIYDESTLGTANNSITFNDYTASPVYRVEHTVPFRREIRESDVPIPNAPGVADFETYEGKSYFLIEGQMFPYGEAEFYAGRRALRSIANLERAQDDPLSDGGYVPYKWLEAGTQKMIFVKVERVDGLDESSSQGYMQPFKFTCKVKAPYIYDAEAVTATIALQTAGTPVGASGYPLKFPHLYGKTVYSVGGSVTNAGDLGAYPAFVIAGPVNKPKITNVTTGEYLEVDVNLASSSDSITIFYDLDTPPSILQGGVSKYDKKTSGSTFFKIQPGDNELTFTGTTIGEGAQATVSFYSTYSKS